jgi:hypothetical protein
LNHDVTKDTKPLLLLRVLCGFHRAFSADDREPSTMSRVFPATRDSGLAIGVFVTNLRMRRLEMAAV